MSTSHTPEPWTFTPDQEEAICPRVCYTGDIGGFPNPLDGARAVACVNACYGINPEYLPAFIEAAKKLREKPITGDVMRFDIALQLLTPTKP